MRTLPWLLFGIALVAASYVSVLLINAAVELDDARSQEAYLSERSALALRIARKGWIGRDEASVQTFAAELEADGVITKRTTDDSFELGDIIVEVKDGVVTQMKVFD